MTLSAVADGSSHALWMAQCHTRSSSILLLLLQGRPVSTRRILRVPAAIRPVQPARRWSSAFAPSLESAIRTCAARQTPLFEPGAGSPALALAPACVIPAPPNAILARSGSHSLGITRRWSPQGPSVLHNTRPGPDKSFFSTSASTMTATKIDGTAIAKGIRERLHAEIAEKQKINPRYNPSLRIIQGLSGHPDRTPF